MAMTAWSAKVWTSSIWASENGPGARRASHDDSIASRPRGGSAPRAGCGSRAAVTRGRCSARAAGSSISGTWIDARVDERHGPRGSSCQRVVDSSRASPPGLRRVRVALDQHELRRPRHRRIAPRSAPHRRTAQSSDRGRRPAEYRSASRLMTRRTSPSPSAGRARRSDRGCCASSSLNSRTFSMAITAWSAKVWSSAICCRRRRARPRVQ